jgi:heat shock protein HtpX
MWELIRANRRKSIALFIVMGLMLLILGYLIGEAYWPRGGGVGGVAVALLVWGIWSLVGYFAGDSILLKSSGAKQVTPDVHPQLFNVVEEMKIASGLARMPRVYIIDSPAPNAFAIGRTPEKCSIAVTAGLLAILNRDELQGVVAHETAHIHNRDIQFMTYAGIMLGTVVLISHMFLRSLWFSGGRSSRYRSRSGNRNSGQGQAIVMVVAIVFAILAPIMARLLYLAISRRREYLADASGARFTRYPEGLASALEKISGSKEDLKTANKVTAPMYIVNPLKGKGKKLANLSSTHPPITERIRILRSMAGGAGYADYQSAYEKVHGKKSSVLPQSALADKSAVPIMIPGQEQMAGAGQKSSRREFGDVVRAVNQYLFLFCAGCGLKIKVPPEFKKKQFPCPRCKTQIEVPLAEMATVGAVLESVDQGRQEAQKDYDMVYSRKRSEWESFRCNCGKTIQLSPHFSGNYLDCSNCRRKIKIELPQI